MSFYRTNLGDEFILHYSGEVGAYAWAFIDENATVIAASPDQTGIIAGSYVGGVAYDQSSTESGYSYYIGFYLLDPLVTTYSATFTVTGSGNPISGASVTCNGSTQATDGLGQVIFTDLVDGNYPYSITTNGYLVANGSITVNGGDINEPISLTPTAVETVVGEYVTMYPNPVIDYLYIKDTEEFTSVSIYDINGRVVYATPIDGDISVSFADMAKGLYVVRLIGNSKSITKKIVK
jgi:hypothetical protein